MPGGASRLGRAFASRRTATGLIPFLTAGYPSLDASLEIMRRLEAAGALSLEVGIPFSDPIADGPEIQRASEWALRSRVGPADALDLVGRYREAGSLPVVVMTYANPVFRLGVERFAERARGAGVDGVLITDLPPDESPEAWQAFDDAGLDTVMLIAPTTAPERIPSLLARCRGFVYSLARTGVTGGAEGYAGSLADRIGSLRRQTSLPIAVGFGISNPDQARTLRGLADGVVVGAAFMRAISGDPEDAPRRVEELARDLIHALE